MLHALVGSLLLALAAPAPAPAKAPAKAPADAKPATTPAAADAGGADAPASTGATDPSEDDDGGATTQTSGDITRYSFTGLDIDGELRTPALLQFLARIGGEFETVGIPHRSFMPELSRTTYSDAL